MSIVMNPNSPRRAHSPYATPIMEPDYFAESSQQTIDTSRPPAYWTVPSVVPGTVHTPLMNSCQFLQIPAIAPIQQERALPDQHKSLFLGQVRFEVQAQELRWVIRNVCGVTPLKIETRGLGCFLVHLRNDKEVAAVRQLHKRILFDCTGVWFARSASEVDVMASYVTSTLPSVSRRFRLPRDSLVVEQQKTRSEESSPMMPPTRYNSFNRGGHSNHYMGSTPPSPSVPLPSYNAATSGSNSNASSCGASPSLGPHTPSRHTESPPPYAL